MNDDFLPTRRSLLGRLGNWEDQESWREFFNTYWRLIYTTALRAGLNETEAEDVVQETVVSVARRMSGFKYDPAKCSFKTWLRVLCDRRIADQFRKRGRRVPTVPLSDGDGPDDELDDDPADPASLETDPRWEEEWEQTILRAALERVKGQVTALRFQIYDYHVMQGSSISQTCRAFRISAPKVYLEKHRVGKLVKREVAALRKANA